MPLPLSDETLTPRSDADVAIRLAPLYRQILVHLGEDPQREGLIDTPQRAAKAMAYMTQGYHQTLAEVTNGAVFSSSADELVVIKNIEFYSLCEHHLLPFIGHCHIGYLPQGKVLGLSKFARIVDLFARRLQIQEQLTQQIAQAVEEVTGAAGVGVIVEAKHMCMMMRGVEKQNASMRSSVMLGQLKTSAMTRQEFLKLVE